MSKEQPEPFCINCYYCFPDPHIEDVWICDNILQIHTVVKEEDYCFRHEPVYTEK